MNPAVFTEENLQKSLDEDKKKQLRLAKNPVVKTKGQVLESATFEKWKAIPYNEKKKYGIALNCK